MKKPYSEPDIINSAKFLVPEGFIELLGIHQDYRKGHNFEWNLKNGTLPVKRYAKDVGGVLYFVKKYHPDRLLLMGINPRPEIYKNSRGFPIASREEEIQLCQNLLLDIDFRSKEYLDEKIAKLEFSLEQKKEYFKDLGIREPIINSSGQGKHLVFAFSPIPINECPDIKERLKYFIDGFRDEYKQGLKDLDARVDSTISLAQKLKIYGTSKAGKNLISKWHGPTKRIEDSALRDYLLSLNISEPKFPKTDFHLNVKSELPTYFIKLLEKENAIKELWEGTGKKEGDVSSSGFDFSLTQKLIKDGYTDISDLATILALRPDGSYQKSHKNEQYLKRTIASALMKS